MSKKELAIGVFAKTPGLSPLKTRLATVIGVDHALEFFRLSLNCIRETLNEFSKIQNADVFFITAETGSSKINFGQKIIALSKLKGL